MDCGPACLAMIGTVYGKKYTIQYLREKASLSREGVSLTGLADSAEAIGFETFSARTSVEELIRQNHLPCILYWNDNHFVVLYKIKKHLFSGKYIFKIADPAIGPVSLPEVHFKESWIGANRNGVAMFLEPLDTFYENIPERERKIKIKDVLQYVQPHKWEVFQLVLCMAFTSLLTLVFPFLTQSLIDKGVSAKNVNIVIVILAAQIFLFLGTTIMEIVRNWLVLYIGARMNISIISDFFKKLMKLPLRFFDTRFKGDFYQRIQDHSRIQQFLTSQSLTTFFSLINFSIFFVALFHYDYKILVVYISMTIIAIIWSRLFFKKREQLDYFRFRSSALNQESINEMLNGIQEIKINNFHDYKRSSWEGVQVKLFNLNLNVLRLDQTQVIGYDFINQLKNIAVTFLTANEVIRGNITLGAMLGVSYIIGQMNSPVNQLIAFFRSLQDAQLSMKRLMEVHEHEEEEREDQIKMPDSDSQMYADANKGIFLKNVSFKYAGSRSPYVLKDINIFIPDGKTTAIVGGSGSGKTTLMKLLLKFYEPTEGNIYVNQHDLNDLSATGWRAKCGAVMQDGYIFGETISRNIATSEIEINERKLHDAVRIAYIEDFIESQPLKFNTKLGYKGNGISGGQKQRILIARAVYKRPHYIFFDEATSSLDAESERIIHENLKEFFVNKTVLIIAHRLSTVVNADQIIVLKDGKVVEVGDHNSLTKDKGHYYNLVKNQLELEKI